MKRYIKINSKKEIVDIFHENVRDRFDGTEIFFDEVPQPDVHVNGKCIFCEFGFPNFYFKSGVVSDVVEYADKRIEKTAEKEKQRIKTQLISTDKDLPRITEDIIFLLIDKNLIKEMELAPEVMEKLNERKLLRQMMNS